MDDHAPVRKGEITFALLKLNNEIKEGRYQRFLEKPDNNAALKFIWWYDYDRLLGLHVTLHENQCSFRIDWSYVPRGL